jgi:hypothetical protein
VGAFEDSESIFSDEQLKGEAEAEKKRLELAQRIFARRFRGVGEVQQVAALAALIKAMDTPLSGRSVIEAIGFSLDMTPTWEEAKQNAAAFNAASLASLERLADQEK